MKTIGIFNFKLIVIDIAIIALPYSGNDEL